MTFVESQTSHNYSRVCKLYLSPSSSTLPYLIDHFTYKNLPPLRVLCWYAMTYIKVLTFIPSNFYEPLSDTSSSKICNIPSVVTTKVINMFLLLH